MWREGTSWVVLSSSLALLVLGYQLLIPDLSVTGDIEYHGDEGRWIAAGDYYFQQFFLKRNWSTSAWSHDRFGSFGTRNPVVGKYIVGASLHFHGVGNRYTGAPAYDFEHDFAWNTSRGNVPPPDELVAARRPIAWMGMLSSVLVFLLTRSMSHSWLMGLCAGTLFILDPLVLYCSRLAMVDIPALFFSLATLWMGVQLYAALCRGERRRSVLWFIGVGIGLGLAVGTKLNALLIAIVVGAWGIVNLIGLYSERHGASATTEQGLSAWAYLPPCERLASLGRRDFRPVLNTMLGVALSALVGSVTFLALNPFLYPHPLKNTWHLFEFGRIVANYEVPVDQRLGPLTDRLGSPLQVGIRQTGMFNRWLNWPWVDGALVCLGMLMCARTITRRGQESKLRRNYTWFAIWLSVELAGIVCWTPFRWPRWYLPLEPCWAILEAQGILLVMTEGRRLWRYVVNSTGP